MNLNFDKKGNALVCGMAKSGVSAAILLKNQGWNVILQDIKPMDKLKDIDILRQKGIEIYAGKNPDDIIEYQDLIVLSPGIPSDLSFVVKAEKLNKPVISEVELGYKFCPCNIAAITGTNGKTTTTALSGELFKTKYKNTAIVGNIGLPFTQKVEELKNDDYVVIEISSFQMEKSYDFHPKISAVLNITPDHLNRHKTMENYIAAKEKIFKNQTKNDFCILNYEDEICRKMSEKTEAKVMFFSSKRNLKEGIYLNKNNIIIKWNTLDEVVIDVKKLKILGTHNYENAMAAIGIAVCAGISLEDIRKTLENFKAVEHRIEFVETVDGVDYYNDSKGTNPDASIKAVLAMQKPIILIGGGYNKNSNYDEWVKTFKGRVKHIILIGETADKIEECCLKYDFKDITKTSTFESAVDICRQKAQKGDCVLLSPACASWGMFDNYEQRGELFKNIVRSYLK